MRPRSLATALLPVLVLVLVSLAAPAQAAPRKLEKLEPNAVDIVRAPSKFKGLDRRHVVLRPGRIDLMVGAQVVASTPFSGQGLADLATAVQALRPGWIVTQGPGVFLLRTALVQAPGTSLRFEAPAVRQVRLASGPEIYLSAFGATGRFTGVTVTSWQEASGRPNDDPGTPRPFVLYAGGSRLEIARSTFAYLGSDRASAYGVNWHQSTGRATNSTFHHNFFGAYTYAAHDVAFVHDVFRDNAIYGLDPHTSTTRLLVDGNVATRNRVHGIVFSIDVTNSVVRGNHSYANGANGIVMDDGSDRNTIVGNRVEANKGDGIVLLGSSGNRVEANTVTGNRVGIRVNLRSVGNQVVGNQIRDHRIGVQVYGGAQRTALRANTVGQSAEVGLVLDGAGSSSRGDVVDGAATGVEVRGVARVDRTTVAGTADGIVVDGEGIADLDGIRVTAAAAGITGRPGAIVRLRDSRVRSPEPLAGVAPQVATGNDLAAPTSTGWLSLAGLGFLLAASALFLLQRLRNRGKDAAMVALSAEFRRVVPRVRRPARRRARLVARRMATVGAVLGLAALGAAGGVVLLDQRAEARSIELTVNRASDGSVSVALSAGRADPRTLAGALDRRGYTNVLLRQGDAWLLNRPLVVGPGASLRVRRTTLRLRSEPHTVVGLEAMGGSLVFDQATVTSWDTRADRADGDPRDGRAWVAAAGGGRMDVLGSRLERLGYDAAGRYGAVWRGRGTSGSVAASTVTGNFYGLAADGSAPLRIADSTVQRSQRFGIDASGASGVALEGNVLRDNGRHGLVLAASGQAVVSANKVFGNHEHGIVVFDGADDARLGGNQVHDNGASGIDVNRSVRVRLRANTVWANRFGVTLHEGATAALDGNRLTANLFDGVRVAGRAELTAATGNLADHNARAGLYVGDGAATFGPGNRLSGNDTGVWVDGAATAAVVRGNRVSDNVIDGVHLVGTPGDLVEFEGNTLSGNRKSAFSVSHRGVAARFVGANTLDGVTERVRDEVEPGGLRKGRVGQALDGDE
jgi:parallel beta-helix repeat protein